MLPDWFLITALAYFVINIVYRTAELADTKEWTRIRRDETYWYKKRMIAEHNYWLLNTPVDAPKVPAPPPPASPDKAG